MLSKKFYAKRKECATRDVLSGTNGNGIFGEILNGIFLFGKIIVTRGYRSFIYAYINIHRAFVLSRDLGRSSIVGG